MAIVIVSIFFVDDGVYPPPQQPRIELEQPGHACFIPVASPKSCAFPDDDIVTKSITLDTEFPAATAVPFAITPRVGDENPAGSHLPTLKLPKSKELPVDANVTASMVSETLGVYPPQNNARV